MDGAGEREALIKNGDSRTSNYSRTRGHASPPMQPAATGEERGRADEPPRLHGYRVRFSDDGGADGAGWWSWAALDGRLPSAAARLAAVTAAVAVAWCLLRVNVTQDELVAVPGGSVTSVFTLYVASAAAGRLTAMLGGRVPPLLGMMVAGIALQNCGLYTVPDKTWCFQLVAIMREAALSVILVKGGLELNARQLRRHSSAVIRLALLPCIFEALAAAVAVHYALPKFSWEWGLSLGFVLSAVSPAVLVPSLSKLKSMGYGEESGVNTLVIASSSLDDIVSISAFGVLMGIVFSTGDLTSKIIQGPVDVCIGTALGLVWGFLLIFIPPSPWAEIYREEDRENHDEAGIQSKRSVTAMRAFLLGAGGVLAVTGSHRYGYPGAGPLACIVSSFVAANGWRWRTRRHVRDACPTAIPPSGVDDEAADACDQDNSVEHVFDGIWYGLEPVLFASIGTEVKFELLAGGVVIFAGLWVLVAGLIVRLIVTTCSVVGTKFNPKEVTFINIAWLPKATVQAALAPVALDMARSMGTPDDKEIATQLLTIAVISILVTAPIGALGIQFLGPILLSNSSR